MRSDPDKRALSQCGRNEKVTQVLNPPRPYSPEADAVEFARRAASTTNLGPSPVRPLSPHNADERRPSTPDTGNGAQHLAEGGVALYALDEVVPTDQVLTCRVPGAKRVNTYVGRGAMGAK